MTEDQSHKRIHLIRHGMTEGNQKGWYYGKTDLPLCEKGRNEIKELARKLEYPCTTENPSVTEYPGATEYPCGETPLFFTTGVSRTEETFELIYGAREHGIFEAFLEMDFGDFECHSYEELKNVPAYQEWIKDDECIKNTYHGESRPDFEDRVWQGWQDLIRMLGSGERREKGRSAEHDTGQLQSAKHDTERPTFIGYDTGPDTESARTGEPSDIVIVCHGGPISAVMERCFPGQRKWIFEWIPKPGRGFSVEIKDGQAISFSEI